MQKVLVTGSAGFLGSYLVPMLAVRYQVIATSKEGNPGLFNHPNIIQQSLDFTDAEAVQAVFEKHKPEVVVHAGAMSKPDDCALHKKLAWETNVTGTQNLLRAAANTQSFFIFVSTDFVFDGNKGMYAEEDPTGEPVNYYGVTKLEAESLVVTYPYLWSIIRTVLVYGKPLSGRQNILTVVKDKLEKNEIYRVFHDQVRTPTYVQDLAGAILKIIDLKKGGLYHISGEDVMTPYQMAVATADYLQLNKNLLQQANRQNFQQPALRPLKTGFDISKAKRELQFQPTSFAEGLRKTFD